LKKRRRKGSTEESYNVECDVVVSDWRVLACVLLCENRTHPNSFTFWHFE